MFISYYGKYDKQKVKFKMKEFPFKNEETINSLNTEIQLNGFTEKFLYFFTNKIKNYKKLQTKLFRIRNQYYTVEKSKLYRSRTKKKKK